MVVSATLPLGEQPDHVKCYRSATDQVIHCVLRVDRSDRDRSKRQDLVQRSGLKNREANDIARQININDCSTAVSQVAKLTGPTSFQMID
jgi:hypothetical protein